MILPEQLRWAWGMLIVVSLGFRVGGLGFGV